MIYRIVAILTVVVVIAGSLLLARQNGTQGSATVRESSADEGYSARNAQLIQTGPSGLPLYTLNAATIRQLPDADLVQLSQVSMSFQNGGEQWTATSDQGQLVSASNQIELSGHVQVSGILPGSSAPIHISTDALSFNSRARIVSTADPVTVDWAGRRLDARGMVADLKAHRLQLESSVHAVLTPSR